ncbi:RDD family protein [Bosea sp. 2KB_26]|uniref:RDD family protein n=1 Tax=Bosea sp. 2KB_26 TaxID=3237475 RepID=UPI003F930F95
MAQRLDRINRLLDGVTRNRREITSPEGIVLEVDIANPGERLVAFLIDFLFWMLGTILLYVILRLMLAENFNGSVAITIVLFVSFLLRNLYFIHFELQSQGATPGKRITSLKVIDRGGGPLLPGAIIARNLTREVEIFLPLGLFFAVPQMDAGASFWTAATYFGWALAVSALPFFNRDRLRAGDLIAGTMVISVPRRALLAELARDSARYVFSRSQLEAYGAFELQVLEELLRRPTSPDTTLMQQQVCTKICRKIGWTEPVPAAEALDFLRAFYTAERAHLEREQLFGHYRADKTEAAATRR